MRKPAPAKRARKRTAPSTLMVAAGLAVLVAAAGAFAGRGQAPDAGQSAPSARLAVRIPEEHRDEIRSLATVFVCYGVTEHAVIRATYNANRDWRPGKPLVLNLRPTAEEAKDNRGASALLKEVQALRDQGAAVCSRDYGAIASKP